MGLIPIIENTVYNMLLDSFKKVIEESMGVNPEPLEILREPE